MKKNKIIIGIIFICFLQALVSCSPIQSVTYIYRSSSSDKPFPAIKISTNKGANDTYTHISIFEVHHTVDKNTFHRILQYSIKFSYSDTIPQKGYSPWYSYGLLLSSDKITERCVLDKNFRYVTYCDCYNGGYKVSRSGTEVVGDKKTQRYMVGRTAAEGY
ncbi:MAG: hypothetical protein LBV75_06245, partial [Paludibacter sp.]|nr:hypothetical protein [Paludibacter sp.]